MAKDSCVSHYASYRVTIRQDYVDMFDGDHCAATLMWILEFATNGEIHRLKMAEESGDPWIKASLKSLTADAIGLYSERSIADRLAWIRDLGFVASRSPGLGQVNSYLLDFKMVSESLKSRKRFSKSDCKIADEETVSVCSPVCSPVCKNDSPILKEELRTKNKEEEIPPTPSFDADSFLIESRKLPGKHFTGKDAKRIRDFWNPEWSELVFEKIVPLVDRELGKHARPTAHRESRSAPPRYLRVGLQETLPAVVGRCLIFEQYIEIFKLAGKPIGDYERQQAWALWEPLTTEQRVASGRDAARLCQKTADPDFIPSPANHLKKMPWTREVQERVLPVPMRELSKHEQALEIGRRKGLM